MTMAGQCANLGQRLGGPISLAQQADRVQTFVSTHAQTSRSEAAARVGQRVSYMYSHITLSPVVLCINARMYV